MIIRFGGILLHAAATCSFLDGHYSYNELSFPRKELSFQSEARRNLLRSTTPKKDFSLHPPKDSSAFQVDKVCRLDEGCRQRKTDDLRLPYLISITSFSFILAMSSIFLISSSVNFWISSSARFSSSSVIFLSFIAFLMASLPSRRMLRTAVR
jgi:hypothetical protein